MLSDFLDPFIEDPIFYTNLLPSSNSNGNPSTYFGLLTGTCSFDGLNYAKEGFISTFYIYSLIAYRPSCVAIVIATNVVVNVGNVMDFQWSPSNLHVYPHQNVNVLHLLETLCHVPS